MGLVKDRVGRAHNRECGRARRSTIPHVLAGAEHGMVAEADREKREAGVLCFWRHLEPKRKCFLFQQNGTWEAGTKFNICQNTEYGTLKSMLPSPYSSRNKIPWLVGKESNQKGVEDG